MGTEPVFIADRAHLLQSRAAHAGRKLTRLPRQSKDEPNRAACHSVTNSLGVSITPASKTRTDKSGARADRSQSERPARRTGQGFGQGLAMEMRVPAGAQSGHPGVHQRSTVLKATFHFSVRLHKINPLAAVRAPVR